MIRVRLDVAVVQRGLARSRSHAAELIRAGRVQVDGSFVTKASARVDDGSQLSVDADPWVSRASQKLLGALEEGEICVPPRVLDAGASTGGFTQVLLSKGAERVYAVDVGHGQLAELLQVDSRVVNLEGTHLRDLTLVMLENQPVGLAVADVSFISLTQVLAPILGALDENGSALLMVKPQFEVGRENLGSGGVVRSPELHRRAVDGVIAEAQKYGFNVRWQGESQILGPAGNREFFVHLVPAPGRLGV